MLNPLFNLRCSGDTPQASPNKTVPKSSWKDHFGPICSGTTVKRILRWQPEADSFGQVLHENLPYQESKGFLVSNAPNGDSPKYRVDLRMNKQIFLSALPTIIGFFNSANVQHAVSKEGDGVRAWFTSAKKLDRVVSSLKRVIRESAWGNDISSFQNRRTIAVREGEEGPPIAAMPLLGNKSVAVNDEDAKIDGGTYVPNVRRERKARVADESGQKADFTVYERFQKLQKKAAEEAKK